ncbi:TonB-dependent receptor [Neiella sp. HB171785]|uniref:TonB-dependent receptor n=1 Tax=Neiella litorisoli TaxID=2771431 RepID=A0A8J6QFD8_9GAMM|nr:TonB-dependent receptor [Neiella litorisoli]MBD1388704.1 TonB-dependent receptor [Neiella litorisoli]
MRDAIKHFAINGCLLSVCCPFSVSADDVDVFELSLDELLQVKITTNTLDEKSVQTIPAPITVFTRSDIDSLGARYLHEVLAYVPGYQVARYTVHPYEYSASARALSDGSSSKKILFLLDGHAVNDPRSGNSVNLANFSLHHIERIEVIRGPGSSIYGSNAFTGVINLITRQSTPQVSLATGNELNGDLFAMHRIEQDNFSIDFQANIIDADGDSYRLDDTFSPEQIATSDPYSQFSYQLKFTAGSSSLLWHHRRLDMDDFYHSSRISNRYNQSRYESMFLLAEHELVLFDTLQSTLIFDAIYTDIENSNQSTPEGAFAAISEPASEDPLHGTGYLESNRFKLGWHNNWQITEHSNAQFGIDWQRSEETRAEGYTNFSVNDVLNQNIPIRSYPGRDSMVKVGAEDSATLYGAYVQLQTTTGDFNWIAGGRLDHYRDFGSQFSPRVGAVYVPSSTWQFKALYGEAFRAPELSETGLFSGISRAGNQDLDSEKIKTFDLIGQYVDTSMMITINGFYNRYSDPIVSAEIDGRTSLINGDDEQSKGVEAEFIWSGWRNSRMRLSATHFYDLPDSAFRESDTLASVQLNQQISDFQLGLSGTYRSDRQSLTSSGDFINIDGYWLWNAQLRYLFSSQWGLSLTINNLENKQHINPSIADDLNGVHNKGRHWVVEVTRSFD